METLDFQTEEITCCCNENLELPFSIEDINNLLEQIEDDFEIEIMQSVRIKPKHTGISASSFEIDFSAIRVDRIKPSL